MSPTARTLAFLREHGYFAQVVEQTIPRTFIKRDFGGVLDIIALKGPLTLGIQVTSGSNVAARLDKIRSSPTLPILLAAGWRVSVWGWAKQGARGKRKTWTLREVEVA